MTQMDPQAVKQVQHDQWNDAAPNWKKHDARLRDTSEGVTRALIEAAGIREGQHVLDIASGTGEPGLPAAHIVGPDGRVLLTDIAEDMIAVARDKAAQQGLSNVDFQVVDGETLDVGDSAFDAALCRWGIMFMPEPLRCLQQTHRALKPGGRMAVAVWGPPERNPFFTTPMRVLANYTEVPTPPPGAPGVFAFADQERLRSVLSGAGFKDVRVDGLDVPMAEFDSGAEYWAYIRELAAPIAILNARVPEDRRAQLAKDVAEAAEEGGRVRLGGYALIASGVK